MVNKRQYKNNRSYRTGYDDGFDDGVSKGFRKNKAKLDEYTKELIDVNNELLKEKHINKRIKADADKARADADKARADADKARADAKEQSGRLDNLQERVNELDSGLSELYEESAFKETKMEDIDDENSELDSKNLGIRKDLDILRNNNFSQLDSETLIKIGEAQIKTNCERISWNNTRRHQLNDEIRILKNRINKLEAESYNLIKNMVKQA